MITIINYIDNMKITFKQLEVFISIAKKGNMTQAANELYLTQSACSMALSAMENQLGGVLFDRHGKKLILNDRGRVLFPKAANIISQVQELQDLMTGKNEDILAGHLIVGGSTTIGNYILPKVIGDFVTAHPQTKITLSVDNTEHIIQKLLKFDIDIGMIEGNCYADEIEIFPWKKDELIIFASREHPLANKRKITSEDLYQARWILREKGSGTREKFEEALDQTIKPFLELGNSEAIKQAVLAGLGISCLSKTAVSDLLATEKLVELKTPFLKLTRDFYILLHKEKHQTIVLNRFVSACKKVK